MTLFPINLIKKNFKNIYIIVNRQKWQLQPDGLMHLYSSLSLKHIPPFSRWLQPFFLFLLMQMLQPHYHLKVCNFLCVRVSHLTKIFPSRSFFSIAAGALALSSSSLHHCSSLKCVSSVCGYFSSREAAIFLL